MDCPKNRNDLRTEQNASSYIITTSCWHTEWPLRLICCQPTEIFHRAARYTLRNCVICKSFILTSSGEWLPLKVTPSESYKQVITSELDITHDYLLVWTYILQCGWSYLLSDLHWLDWGPLRSAKDNSALFRHPNVQESRSQAVWYTFHLGSERKLSDPHGQVLIKSVSVCKKGWFAHETMKKSGGFDGYVRNLSAKCRIKGVIWAELKNAEQ